MIFQIKKILIIFFFLTISTKAQSNDIIAYMDIDYVFKNSNLGKKIIFNLNKQNKKNLLDLKKKEDKLVKIEKDLVEKKKFLSKVEFDNKLADLKSNIKLFRAEKDELVKSFERKKNDEIKIFFKKVNPILEKFMTDNSIKIIIDKKNVLIAKEALDVTMNINTLINQELDK